MSLSLWNVLGIVTDLTLISFFVVIGIPFKKIFISKNKTNSDNPLVVLIHGSDITSWQWGMAEIYLWSKRINYYSVDYDSSQDIMESYEKVKLQLTPFLRNDKYKEIIVVGHSQGGLISRMLYNEIGNITSNFMLNVPQQGAKLAKIFNDRDRKKKKIIKKSREQMEPDSMFTMKYKEMCKDMDSYQVSGSLDFVSVHSSLWKYTSSKIYKSWFGHFFSAVNPYLWYTFIIPNIKN